MKHLIILALICVTVITASKIKLIRDKACPENRPIFNNLDLKRISGFWYLLYDYENDGIQCDCGSYDMNFGDPKNFYVRGCCRYLDTGKDDCDAIPKRMEFKAEAIIKIDPESKGVFDGVKDHCFTMMDTDYENYAISYACYNLPNGKSEEEVRIGSRTPTLNPEMQSKVDEIIDQYFERSKLRKINHDLDKCKGLEENFVKKEENGSSATVI